MPVIHEEVTIGAPREAVWHAVHEDLKNAPRWSGYLTRVTLLTGRVPKEGSRLRMDLQLPGGIRESLEVEQTVYEKPEFCECRFVGGPLKGVFSYAYEEEDGATHLVYEMDYELTGLLRFLGGVLKGQYASGIRDSMAALKDWVEARAK